MLINLSPLDFKVDYEDAMGSKGQWIGKAKDHEYGNLGCQEKVMEGMLGA